MIKNKMYSLINLTGLTIGMTCFILIALFIQFELSFDRQHENADRIYRIAQQQKGNEYGGSNYFALAPLPLSEAMKKDFPEVQAVTNLNVNGALLIKDETTFVQQGLYTDPSFFDVFMIPVIKGIGKEALEDPNAILLTESLAKKLFGTASPIDQTLLLTRQNTMTVKGVVADPPKNQHFTYDYIVSLGITGYYSDDIGQWASNNYHSYLKLADGHNYKDLERKMAVYEQFTKPAYKGQGFKFYPEFMLQPIIDIHLRSDMNAEIGTNSDIQYIYLFALIGIIILALASVNYMNLATTKSAQRAKEVGMCKVLGAHRINLIFQFLGESFLLTLFSFSLALALSVLLLPLFNELLGKNIPFEILGSKWIIAAMLLLALVIGILSGLYPAFFLSRVSPIKALKGNFLRGYKEGALLRNTMVVGQFMVAIGLGIGSMVIYQQMQFIQNKKLGYNKQQVVHVPYFQAEVSEKEDMIRETLLKHPKIHKVSLSTQLPLNVRSNGPVNRWEGNPDEDQLHLFRSYVDYDFIDLFKMKLVEGRNFSKDFASDSTAYILNESAVKALGWKKAVGKEFNDGKVIGVLQDFHLQTFDRSIEPLFMILRNEDFNRAFGQVILKIDMDNYAVTKDFIEKTLKEAVPLTPFEVQFMEDSYAQLYDEETKLGAAFNVFAFLALFIAAMGLFGLVSFHVLQRTKEIGVRKVLGSSVSNIVGLISKDFLKLVLLALAIAGPLAYYFTYGWLEQYAYRIDIEWWFFALVGLATLGVAFITIVLQSIKAALANPVKSLRAE